MRRRRSYYSFALSMLVLAATCLLPYGASAGRQPTGAGSVPQSPLVTGADYTLKGSQFQTGPSDAKEKSLKGDLMLPPGTREATYTSDTTKAPISFTDVAPHWRATTPEGTSIDVELRTSPDGQVWSAWLATDLEEIQMPQDSGAETFAGVVPVGQSERTHRYVQSRLTLRTTNPALTPVFQELTYTFINSGVTPKAPKPQAMAQGTPSDIPKPLMVSRKEWGSPQGQSSPKWTPKYKRVTHVIIHHTATPNNDTDFPARVRAIWYFHTYTRGWGDIGYNYVVDPNGIIYEGRAGGDDVEAGHAYPFNNGSMGVGMLGNFMVAAPTTSAQSALIDLISWKVNQRGIDPQGTASFTGYTNCGGKVTYNRPTIAGHRDFRGEACGKAFNATTCPGDRLWSMLPQIRSSIIAEQPPLRAAFTQHDTPGNISPGATIDVHLSMRNSGSLTWTASGQGSVMLGYQWYTPDGKLVKDGWKDIKTPLPRNVPFADTITVTAQLNAPTNIGHYTLVWDMFRDGQGWFNDQGSLPLRVDVVVGKGGTDKLAPKSTVLPLPIYSNSPEIVVRWAGEDEPKGSGIVSYDVQF
ncbi:MAG TPA: N-acetylmuramoyl-L-alanine amidase, partial [Chloroflexia bacterium]|nr:N-acetylmuramoyl-L-alanine amidase [Chloroflexia bacterium]